MPESHENQAHDPEPSPHPSADHHTDHHTPHPSSHHDSHSKALHSDSHDDHHSSSHSDHHDGHHDHHHVQFDAKEGYAEYQVQSKLRFLFAAKKHTSFLGRLRDYFVTPAKADPEKITIPDFEELSDKQKKVRVLLALERLNVYNSHFFTDEEKKWLIPSRRNITQNAYLFSIYLVQILWLARIVMRRMYSVRNFAMFFGTSLFLNVVMAPIPLRIKESWRIRNGLKMADKYLKANGEKMADFARILHPYANTQWLEHFSLKKPK